MLDLRHVRSEPESVKESLAKRDPAYRDAIDRVLALDEERRAGLAEVNDLKAERNSSSKRIGELKRAGEDATQLVEAMRQLGERIDAIDEVRALMEKPPIREPNKRKRRGQALKQ